MLNTEFNEFIPVDKATVDIYPQALREEIDKSHEWVYPTVNSKCIIDACAILTASCRWCLSFWLRNVAGSIRDSREAAV